MKNIYILLLIFPIMSTLSVISQERQETGINTDKIGSVQENQYNQILAEALLLQLKADSLSRIARDKRIHAREIPDEAMRKELAGVAIIYEREAELSQIEADQLFAKAREIKESEAIRNGSSDTRLTLFKTFNDIKVYHYNMDEAISAQAINELQQTDLAVEEPQAQAGEFSEGSEKKKKNEFDILDKSPYSMVNPFPLITTPYEELMYRIQLGVYGNPVPYDAFAGITPVYIELIKDRNMLKYYAGLFFDLQSVTLALDTIRELGFPDAFIVAFLEGNQISTEKAREIEYADYKL